MKTGLESLEVGAPDITYSGNEGPKSPQEDQRMMQEFQMQQMAGGENDRVRELLLLEETQGLSEEEKEELRQLIKTISAQLPQGGLGDMPMDMEEDPRTMAADGGSMDFAMQGGVKNYLGNQETVSDVPVKWQSGPDKPDTELAYITKAEKDLLLKEDIHGSLKDGPNMGPGGIMSLDSFGDVGGGGQSGGDYDRDPGGAGSFTGATTSGGMSPDDLKLAEAKSGTDYDKFRGKTIDEIKPKGILNYLPSTLNIGRNVVNKLFKKQLNKNRLDYFKSEYPKMYD